MSQKADHGLVKLCKTLVVSRSAYYEYLKRRKRVNKGKVLEGRVISIFRNHRGRYGTRRIVEELKAEDIEVGRSRVRRIMRRYSLRAIQPKSYVPKTTQSPPGMLRSSNLLLGREPVREKDRVWVGDITYLPLEGSKWAYLSIWLDLYSRYIVGWQILSHMREELVIKALKKAVQARRPPKGLIIHTDGGGQYGSKAFRKLIENTDNLQSMTRRDNHYDNAHAESFFSRLKAELLQGGQFRNIEDAYKECFGYIEGYYNTIRRHSKIDYKSPLQFEKELGNVSKGNIKRCRTKCGPKASVSLRSTKALGLGK